jgi:hypothetical protein
MKRLSFDQTFAAVATGAVVGGLIAGFWVLGTPGRQRQISADRQRIEDLQAVADILHQQSQQSLDQEEAYTLPDTLTDSENRTDPVSNQPYTYQRLSDQTYQLCADFATDSSTYAFGNRRPTANAEHWEHPEGTHCFEFDVTESPFFWD